MKKRVCDFCGKEIRSINIIGPEYAVVRLDNHGETFSEFDACPECLSKICEEIQQQIKK